MYANTKMFFSSAARLTSIPYLSLLEKKSLSRFLSSTIIPPHIPLNFKENIIVRHMEKADLKLVCEWAEKEKWSIGKHEVEPLYAADPRGYYILEVNGQPAASLAAVRYSSDLAFLGLFIVLPELRGKGYGNILWDAVTHKIEICQSIGLNAVIPQIERYKRSGFTSRFLNTRFRGNAENIPSEKWLHNDDIVLDDRFSIETLIDYDSKIFSTPRKAFLTQWLKMPESHALVALDHNKNIIGYGVISRTAEGYKIAPLFSNSQEIAEKLYRSLCSFVEKKSPVCIDIAETNPYASALIEQFKLEKVFDTMRMYKGKTPAIDQNKIIGLTSLEIGG
jgi:GNAT superfamily N-acetyltransferase